MKVFLTPKPPATANERTELPPSPDSPWDDVLDGCPQPSTTDQMVKELEKAIGTDEWKENALKTAASDAKESSATLPAVQYTATNVAPGKRQRLK